jgi:hypothetical protein
MNEFHLRKESEITAELECWKILKFVYAPVFLWILRGLSELTHWFWERKSQV